MGAELLHDVAELGRAQEGLEWAAADLLARTGDDLVDEPPLLRRHLLFAQRLEARLGHGVVILFLAVIDSHSTGDNRAESAAPALKPR